MRNLASNVEEGPDTLHALSRVEIPNAYPDRQIRCTFDAEYSRKYSSIGSKLRAWYYLQCSSHEKLEQLDLFSTL